MGLGAGNEQCFSYGRSQSRAESRRSPLPASPLGLERSGLGAAPSPGWTPRPPPENAASASAVAFLALLPPSFPEPGAPSGAPPCPPRPAPPELS